LQGKTREWRIMGNYPKGVKPNNRQVLSIWNKCATPV
jgi:hypothetical protein